MENFNTGYCNAGRLNTGDMNSGSLNSGHSNLGSWNSGDFNLGGWNTNNNNLGDCNVGSHNEGDCNIGRWNSGSFNIGCWNAVNYSFGFLNTQTPKIRIFDEEVDITFSDFLLSDMGRLLERISESPLEWIISEHMTEEEKESNPGHKKTGGFLRKVNVKKKQQENWNKLTKEEKEIIMAIPNFNAEKFKLIMGIDVNKEE